MFRSILIASGIVVLGQSTATAQEWFTVTEPLDTIGSHDEPPDGGGPTPPTTGIGPGSRTLEAQRSFQPPPMGGGGSGLQGPLFEPFPDPCTGSNYHAYAPPEALSPHPAQILTVFLPVQDPQPLDRFPVLLFSPASAFAQSVYPPCAPDEQEPCTDAPVGGLLERSLESGWAVVTVGSVGHDSWPTCEQPEECNFPDIGSGDPPVCGPQPPGCWDQNLFYGPDSPQWDDFNYFYGEKDFTWARQYVAHKADELFLDNDRVVAVGTSTGALYASFLAFGPDRSWPCTVGPACGLGGPGCQVEQDTRIAGLIALEPVVWLEATASVPTLPFAGGLSGAHWPACDDTNQDCGRSGVFGGGTIETVLEDFLVEGSISTWVRAYGADIPVFIASGDGYSTDFARDGDVYPSDFDRDLDGSPLLDFESINAPFDPPLRLHDAWHALVFREDLDMVDSAYHAQHSRLYLRDDTTWGAIPDSLLVTGSGDASGPEDVTLVSGAYGCNCDGSTPDSCDDEEVPICLSVENEELALLAVNWLNVEFCDVTASVVMRNAGTNPNSYTSPVPVLGSTITVTVDLTTTGHDDALIIGFDSPASNELSGGQTLLAFPFLDEGELVNTGFHPGPIATIEIDIPPVAALVGKAIYTQAMHAFGVTPFALSNSQDWVMGCE